MKTHPVSWKLEGHEVTVTHQDKVFWEEKGFTKGDMLEYYRTMAPIMLPYFRDRPVTLRVYPNGVHGFSYYRRDLPQNAPPWLRYVDYLPESKSQTIQLPLIDNAAGLVSEPHWANSG